MSPLLLVLALPDFTKLLEQLPVIDELAEQLLGGVRQSQEWLTFTLLHYRVLVLQMLACSPGDWASQVMFHCRACKAVSSDHDEAHSNTFGVSRIWLNELTASARPASLNISLRAINMRLMVVKRCWPSMTLYSLLPDWFWVTTLPKNIFLLGSAP